MAEQETRTPIDTASLIAGGQAIVRIENDSMQQLAIQKPRPPLKQIINACVQELQDAPEFAQAAFYKIPYKEKADQGEDGPVKFVEGLTIKAAKMMQRHMRNISSGAREVDDTGEKVIVQGAAVDMETNTRTVREKGISRWAVNNKTKQRYPIRQERFELAVEAGKSKAERNALLALMPEPLKAQIFITAKEIAAQKIGAVPGKKALPLKERIQVALTKFATVGLTAALAARYMKGLGREEASAKWTEQDLGELAGIYNALVEGEITIADLFPETKQEQPAVGEAMLDGMLAQAQAQGAEAVTAMDPHKIQGTGTVNLGSIIDGATRAAKDQAKSEAELKAMAIRQAIQEQLERFARAIDVVIPGYAEGQRALTDKETAFVRDVIKVAWPGHDKTSAVFGGDMTPEQIDPGIRKVEEICAAIYSKRGAQKA